MDATTARHDCPRCGGSGTDLDADDWGPAVPCAGCGGAGWVDAAGLARIAELRAWQDERQDAAAVVGRRTPAPTAAD